jgi:arylsulfatase
MTGLHPHQAGIGHMTRELGSGPAPDTIPPAYRGNLNDQCMTLAQLAQGAGYATMMAGKWHLAGDDPADWPLQRGFETYYGCLSGPRVTFSRRV